MKMYVRYKFFLVFFFVCLYLTLYWLLQVVVNDSQWSILPFFLLSHKLLCYVHFLCICLKIFKNNALLFQYLKGKKHYDDKKIVQRKNRAILNGRVEKFNIYKLQYIV